jgi:FkbM family methyltransferase
MNIRESKRNVMPEETPNNSCLSPLELTCYFHDEFPSTIEIFGNVTFPQWTIASEEGRVPALDLLKVLVTCKSKPGSIIHVGADIGVSSIYLAKALDSKVIAVEADPLKIPVLQRNLEANELDTAVEVVPFGLARSRGWADLYRDAVQVSRVSFNPGDLEQPERVKSIKLASIDSMYLGKQPVSMIYLTEQQGWRGILKGAIGTIEKFRPTLAIPTATSVDCEDILDEIVAYNYRFLGVFGDQNHAVFVNGEVLPKISERLYRDHKANVIGRFKAGGEGLSSSILLDEVDRMQTLAAVSFRKIYDLNKMKTQAEARVNTEIKARTAFEHAYSLLYYAIDDKELRKKHPIPKDLRAEVTKLLQAPTSMQSPAIKQVQFPYLNYTRPEGVPVRVGMAALPERVDAMRRSICSLVDQVDEIFVSLNGFEEIPLGPWDPKVKFVLNENIGDLAKFQFLDEEFEGYYFTCDDDILYPGYYIDSIIYYIEKFKGQVAAGWHGSILKKPFENYYDSRSRRVLTFGSAQHTGQFVDILGTGCIGFDARVIRPPIDIFKRPNMADIYFALYLKESRFGRFLVPHDRKEAKDLSFLYEGSSISREGMDNSKSVLNTRAEVNRLVGEQIDWEQGRQYRPEFAGRVLMIGRFDHSRWNKGGIYKSCHLMAAQLRQSNHEVVCVEIDSPINDIISLCQGESFDLCIVYGGDLLAQDSLTYDLVLANLNKFPCPVVFNVSYDASEARNSEIKSITGTLRSQDGLFVFTEAARRLLSDIVDCKIVVFPKTIQLPSVPSIQDLPAFKDTSGIFMGDGGKFLDERITPDHKAILAKMKRLYGAKNLVFVRQYAARGKEDLLDGCKILPHSPTIFDEIAKCRLYLHTQKNCTFEMLPVEMLSRGTPVVYIDMPQSLNQYVGEYGLHFDDMDDMKEKVVSLYNDSVLWTQLQKKAYFGVQGQTYDVTANDLRDAIAAFLS